jgi:hypothetical protein
MFTSKKKTKTSKPLTWQRNGLAGNPKFELFGISCVFFFSLPNRDNSPSAATTISLRFETPLPSMDAAYDTVKASKLNNPLN